MPHNSDDESPRLLSPSQLAKRWNVDAKTVTRWAKNGRLPEGSWVITPGGHRRFREDLAAPPLNGGGS